MTTKKATEVTDDVIAEVRKRAEQTRRRLGHKPGPSELLTPQELSDAAPFYLVLRDYIRQLKDAREADCVTLAELSTRSGLAVETLSRLETGALTNPTWKTLGVYAAALGLRPHLVLEPTRRAGGQDMETKRPSKPASETGDLTAQRAEGRSYKEHLQELKALPESERQRLEQSLCKTCPTRDDPWPYGPWPCGMPASIDPKLVLIGVSRGNSPGPVDETAFISAPTVEKPTKSHFFYPDKKGYWEKLRYLAHRFFLREGTRLSEHEAISLCSHFNLGMANAGKASKEAVEPRYERWVSQLLNSYHNPDLVVLFGLTDILRDSEVGGWWNCEGGLPVNWRNPDNIRPFKAGKGKYNREWKYREWVVQNAQGHPIRVVIWPNHPSRWPFLRDFDIWKASVDEYLATLPLSRL